ncbi:toll/interleukin-1 receptor domain-containing protein [Methylobacterium sp. 092160098-2]|uniref:toll/interleukin-1 receptor domain-containing protein n=1 Tax=Methylobacterium sp. 092160098-2 TaxID=3025129 RepID=UPI002381CA64|nr:toll/interleukin-1 receptor domain-containing protein [Methylobacterium sp. 092160098-2]MDE4910366.1 toll/interleukin-1 receptor domain-containing protein [Methylobacterium sp. 092160098-2]
MAEKTIFLSHITEEKELATLFQEAIENEFSGFVKVFVSSDGLSIPAGTNFLQKIEEGLIDCIGAAYLISPISVKRPWINFELGAVWIRNAIAQRSGAAEIPVLPICHSNMGFRNLPQPIGNLNAIIASQPSQLRFAFTSLQRAVGGRGSLRTNFDQLALDISRFELKYTVSDKLRKLIQMIGLNEKKLIDLCRENSHHSIISIGSITIEDIHEVEFRKLAEELTQSVVRISLGGTISRFSDFGGFKGSNYNIVISTKNLLDLEKS